MSLIMLESWDNYRETSFIGQANNWYDAYGKWTNFSGNLYAQETGRHGYKVRAYDNQGTARLDKQLQIEHEHATLIYGTAWYWNRGTISNVVVPICSFGSDFGGTNHFSISLFTGTGTGADSALIIENALPTGTGANATNILTGFGQNTTGVMSPGIWRYMEIKVTLGTAVGGGRLTIVLAGATIYDQAINTVATGGTKTVFDMFRFYSYHDGSTITHFDDTYLANGAGTVNNTFLGDVIVEQKVADASGSSNTWSNSAAAIQVNNFQYVNGYDVTETQNDYVYSSTNDQSDLYNYQDTTYASPSTIVGVVINTRVDKADTGPRSLAVLAKNGATTWVSTDQVITQDRRIWTRALDLQPDGVTPWTIVAYNATEFGIRTRP